MKRRFLFVLLSVIMAVNYSSLNMTANAQETVRVALSSVIVPVNMTSMYGPLHYGESFGLKMTKEDFTAFNSGPTAAQATLAGQADILNSGVITILALHDSGPDFRIFCPQVGRTDYLVIGRNGVKTLEQVLDPKTRVASDGPTGTASTVLNALFQSHGLKGRVADLPNLKVLTTGDLRQAAWAAGEVDVTVVLTSQYSQLEKAVPDGTIIATLYEEVPDYLFTAFAAQKEWLDKNQETAAAFCASVLQGATKLSSDFDLYNAGIKEFVAKPPSDASNKKTFELTSKYDFWQLKTGITPKAITFMGNLAFQAGILKAVPDPKDVLDSRPYEMALKMLEAVNGTATPDASGTMEATKAAN
jgi:ABC-type nitrate/sulfonate/bicarbonate transport system substrate-binding protein